MIHPVNIKWQKLFGRAKMHGVSQVQIAKEADVSKYMLSRWSATNKGGEYEKCARVWNVIFSHVPLEDILECCDFPGEE